MALEILGDTCIVLLVIIRAAIGFVLEQTDVFLTPAVAVASLIMISRLRDCHLEEIRVCEHGGCGGVPAAGMPVDADAARIDPWIALRQLLYRRHLIRER